MAYLLDTNVFIQAKNLHYGLDFCPAFWEWLEEANQVEKVFSIRQVLDELVAGADKLSNWAKARGKGFYKDIDDETLPKLVQVSEWVQANGYETEAINEFSRAADYFLVSYALAHGHTVVTHEVSANSPHKIKIPNVCKGMGVECVNPFAMLRSESAKFVLPRV